MRILRFLFVMMGCLALLGGLTRPLAAQTASIAGLSQARYQFGQVMHFSLIARGEADIDSVTLFISTPELSHTLTAEMNIEPGRQVIVEHSLDLTQIRLAPFAAVSFWWRVTDIVGNSVTIPRQVIEYADDQFDWQQMEMNGPDDPVRVYWTGEDVALGQAALDITANAMPRIKQVMPVTWDEPLRIYIYPSLTDLQAALRLTGREWVGAHAHPELGVILVTATNVRTAVADLRQSIPHELSHLLLYQATGVGYTAVPLWFDEGLATFFEPTINPNHEIILGEAVQAGHTIPFAELCHSFPQREDQAVLAYAQSASLIRMIQAEYGNQALNQMVRAFADGADCQSAVRRVLGLSLAELNLAWLRDQHPQSATNQFLRQNALWLLILAAGFGVTTLLLLRPPVMGTGKQIQGDP